MEMISSDELKLIGMRESPYVNRVQIALNLKSLNYEFIKENIPTEKSELLLKSNTVHKKVPVLIHKDKSISESLVIVEYIDEIWKAGVSFFPSHPYQRSNVRFWASYIDITLFPPLRELISIKDEELKKAATEKVNEGIILLEDVYMKSSSNNKAFFGGDEIGYLDIVFGCVLGWIKAVEIMNQLNFIDELKTPGLAQWATVFLSHGAVRNIVPDPEELVQYSKQFQARLAAVSN